MAIYTAAIFFYCPVPVVFDCIEFNPHFRKVDVLNDLAFLCIDLDAQGHTELAEIFMKKYQEYWSCMPEPEDAALFLYFKAYRANVRLKVTLIEWRQHPSEELDKTAKRYWDLLKRYFFVDLLMR